MHGTHLEVFFKMVQNAVWRLQSPLKRHQCLQRASAESNSWCQPRKQGNSTNTMQLSAHKYQLSPLLLHSARQQEREWRKTVLTFSLSPKKLLFHTGVHRTFITESYEQEAMRYSSHVIKEQESKVLHIGGALFSVFQFLKNHVSGLCCNVCFLFEGTLSRYILVFPWESQRMEGNETPQLL